MLRMLLKFQIESSQEAILPLSQSYIFRAFDSILFVLFSLRFLVICRIDGRDNWIGRLLCDTIVDL